MVDEAFNMVLMQAANQQQQQPQPDEFAALNLPVGDESWRRWFNLDGPELAGEDGGWGGMIDFAGDESGAGGGWGGMDAVSQEVAI